MTVGASAPTVCRARTPFDYSPGRAALTRPVARWFFSTLRARNVSSRSFLARSRAAAPDPLLSTRGLDPPLPVPFPNTLGVCLTPSPRSTCTRPTVRPLAGAGEFVDHDTDRAVWTERDVE